MRAPLDNHAAMPQHTTDTPAESRYSGVIHALSAAESANLDERGIPKKLGRQFRKVERAAYDKETRTVTMAVSSSTPVDRYYGQEILSHDKSALRTDRLKGGVSLLFNHDYDLLLGRSQSFELGDPLRITSRFGTSELAIEKERDVEAEILVDVSIGYLVHEWEITEDKNGVRTYNAVDWELLEVSLVTVPADPTVGVGRDAKDAVSVKVRSFRKLDDEEDPEDPEEDPDDDGDEEDSDERSATSANTSATSTTTQPTQQRTNTMAEGTVDLAAQNQERITGLRQLRTQYPIHFSEDDALSAITGSVTVTDARNAIADKIIAGSERSKVKTAGDQVLDAMSEKEQRGYSLRNVYCASINQRNPGTFKDKGADAGFEREVSDSLKKEAGERGFRDFGAGIVVPNNLPFSVSRAQQQRAITAGGPVGTVSIVPTVEATPIELLRSRTACLAMGARYMGGLFGTPRMLRQNAAGQSSWLAETAAVGNTDIGFDFISMSPKRLSIQNSYFLEFLAQSPLAIEDLLRDDRNAVLARSLDTAGIAGPGTNNTPLGLLGQSGLAAVLTGTTRAANGTVTAGAGGVPLTYVDVNNFEAAIATANGDIGTMGWVLSPRVRAALRSTPKIPGTASGFVWPDVSPVAANGLQEGPLSYRAIATANAALTGFTANTVPNLHAALFGVWDQMLIGDWGLNEVINDNITGAPQGLFKIIEHGLYDINFRHIESFAASTSILPS